MGAPSTSSGMRAPNTPGCMANAQADCATKTLVSQPLHMHIKLHMTSPLCPHLRAGSCRTLHQRAPHAAGPACLLPALSRPVPNSRLLPPRRPRRPGAPDRASGSAGLRNKSGAKTGAAVLSSCGQTAVCERLPTMATKPTKGHPQRPACLLAVPPCPPEMEAVSFCSAASRAACTWPSSRGDTPAASATVPCKRNRWLAAARASHAVQFTWEQHLGAHPNLTLLRHMSAQAVQHVCAVHAVHAGHAAMLQMLCMLRSPAQAPAAPAAPPVGPPAAGRLPGPLGAGSQAHPAAQTWLGPAAAPHHAPPPLRMREEKGRGRLVSRPVSRQAGTAGAGQVQR